MLAMARDRDITDKQFRLGIQKMSDYDYIKMGICAALDKIREEARIETERDRFVH